VGQPDGIGYQKDDPELIVTEIYGDPKSVPFGHALVGHVGQRAITPQLMYDTIGVFIFP
jgi:hypothetical protein